MSDDADDDMCYGYGLSRRDLQVFGEHEVTKFLYSFEETKMAAGDLGNMGKLNLLM
jgi:hypothetical protein